MLEAIRGNVRSKLAFWVGALDAPTIAAQMQGVSAIDLVGLQANEQVMAGGEKGKAVLSIGTRA